MSLQSQATGASVQSEDPGGLVDYVAVRVAAGTRYRACVSSPSSGGYRLFVTGTGFDEGTHSEVSPVDMFNHLNIFGPHQVHVAGLDN